MAIYYVDGSGGNDGNNGSSASPWKTLNKALDTIAAGDTVRVRTATYYESLKISKANVTFEADTGHTPTIDGRYGPHLFGAAGYTTSGSPIRQIKSDELPGLTEANRQRGNWVVMGDSAQIIELNSPGATVKGFVIRNVCGRAFTVNGSNNKILDCRIDFCYPTTILASDTSKNLLVKGCIVTRGSVKLFDPTRTGTVAAVATGFIIRGEDNVIEENVVCYCYGEGIAASKRGKRQIIRYNISHTNLHWSLGVNGSIGAKLYGNIVYWCDNMYSSVFGPKARLFVAGDEDKGGETSYDTVIYNNLFIGGTKGFEISGSSTGRSFNLQNSYVGYNTFVGRPATNEFVFLYGVAPNPPKNVVFENNIFVRHPDQTGDLAKVGGSPGSGLLSRNALSNAPIPGVLSGSGSQVVGTNVSILVNPFARQIMGACDEKSTELPNPNTTFTLSDYDLSPTSPGIGRASDNRVTVVNGLTLPGVNIDLHKAARTNLDVDAGKFYDVGMDEYGSDDPPPDPDSVSASFNFTPSSGSAPLSVLFSDTSQEFGTANINSWSWTFGDGGVSTQQSPTHVYATPGTYTPQLTVMDTVLGLSSTFTGSSITVHAVVSGSVTANFSRSPSAGQAGVTTFSFTDTSTADGDAVINSRLWEFRDGSTSTAQNPTHVYATPGTYRPKLTVQDTVRGYSHTYTGPQTVVTTTPPGDGVEAGFTVGSQAGPAPLSVTFTDISLASGAAVIDSWLWDFDDGYTSTEQNPTHVYATPGTYSPRLTVQDTVRGLNDTYVGTSILVTAPPPPGSGGDVSLRQIRAALNTSNGNQTFTQTGLGGKIPKSVRFVVTRATTDGAAADGAWFGYGAAAGGAQWAAAVAADHNVTPTNSGRRWTDGACLLLVDGSGNEIVRATFVGWTANGVTVNVQWTGTPAAYLVTAVLGAGTEYQAWAGAVALGAANTNSVITTGFQPDALHCVATWGAQDTADNDATISLGLGHRIGTAYVLERYYPNGMSAGKNYSRLYEGYVAHSRYNSQKRASVSAAVWGVDGVTLTVTNDAVDSSVLVLVEKFGDVESDVALVSTATAAVALDYTLPWDPQYAEHIISYNDALGARNDNARAGTIGLHTVTDDGEFSNEISSKNSAAPADEQSLSDDRLIITDDTGATQASGATALGTGKYTITYTAAPSPALRMIRLAVEEGQAAGGGGDYVAAEFMVDVMSGIFPLHVQFTDLSSGTHALTSWLWDFGDGETSTERNPSHIYQSGGTYTVQLTVSDGTLNASKMKANLINVQEPAKRRIRVGPFTMRPTTEESIPVTHWDADSPEAGFMEGGLLLSALRLNADPEPPTALSDEMSVYVDAASGDLKVKRPDESEGTIDVT